MFESLDNAWFDLIKFLEWTAINLISIFASSTTCLCLKQTEGIFPSLCTSFKNLMSNGMSFFIKIFFSYKHTEGDETTQRKGGGAAHFSLHICQYLKEMTMSYDSLFF